MPSETPNKDDVVNLEEEQKASQGEKVTITRHDSLASMDSLESNPAKFSDEEDLDPFKQALNGMTRKKSASA